MIIKYISSKIDKIKGLALLFKEQSCENKASLEKISERVYLIVDEGWKRL